MIVIDYQNRKPIYEQIVERVESLIAAGVMKAGTQIPSVRALAVELSINPNTIQKAYGILEQRGAIYAVKGKGNFVADDVAIRNRLCENCFERFQKTVREGMSLGISEQAFTERVRKYYEEGAHDRDNRSE